jgi:hypothetical protein
VREVVPERVELRRLIGVVDSVRVSSAIGHDRTSPSPHARQYGATRAPSRMVRSTRGGRRGHCSLFFAFMSAKPAVVGRDPSVSERAWP